MLDVHPPHQAAHTWKDFLIHIATICVGLLIAIGLEQTVEAIHRHHEREELRTALTHESRQILRDTQRVEEATTPYIHQLQQLDAQVSEAARTGHSLGVTFPRRSGQSWDIPDDPIYNAAKASTRIALLPDEEIVDYGELDGLVDKGNAAYLHLSDARRGLDAFKHELSFAKAPGADPFANAAPDQLKQYAAHLAQLEVAMSEFRYWSRQTRGAVTALLQGERDLHKIEAAERQFDKLP